ncbi:DNA-binding response regulator, OmpR family, contains REC and winged-helix (wHTH) domain [Clostridium cavendishii DSM 21758]|uniref:Stage 0 sporulation protein A homolog n=1 Tax=Clostridium cavendishii DSM 21758 TaxID=1121302 RepID=A0A1M6MNH1_9CLOT|nr:response regulator transcription factor [Clostridium cavendishii]SHJ84984.1 DNA-binding response regulator, OmpR family, contains REC and winged-helix (wHTH) domain [Clostridium cavendishii DSM 21758]
MASKILVVEDDNSIRDMLTFALEIEGFKVNSAINGKEAIEKFNEFNPDLVLLDLMLPDINGFELCRKMQKQMEIPIIMVTAKNDIVDKVLGFEIGADDYITKPFHIKEVIARVNKALQRDAKIKRNTPDSNRIKISSNVYIDNIGKVIVKNNEEIVLRPKEYEVLQLLATNKGRVFSREELLNKIWGYDYFGEARTVDVHIRRIREKIEADGEKYIETVFGMGYKMR